MSVRAVLFAAVSTWRTVLKWKLLDYLPNCHLWLSVSMNEKTCELTCEKTEPLFMANLCVNISNYEKKWPPKKNIKYNWSQWGMS